MFNEYGVINPKEYSSLTGYITNQHVNEFNSLVIKTMNKKHSYFYIVRKEDMYTLYNFVVRALELAEFRDLFSEYEFEVFDDYIVVAW